MTEAVINLSSIDFEGLFRMSYNFDLLKRTLEQIILNQQTHEKTIQTLNEKVFQSETINIQKNLLGQPQGASSFFQRPNQINTNNNDDKDFLENQNMFPQFENEFGTGYNEAYFVKKIGEIENKLFKLEGINSIVEDHDKKLVILEQNLEEEHKSITELSNKMNDFNIFDLLKPKGGSSTNEFSEKNEFLSLIQLSERKIFKKFDFVDEKINKLDEEILKLRNNSGIFRMNIENLEKASAANTVKIEEIANNANIPLLVNNNENSKFEFEIKYQINQITEELNTRFNQLNQQIQGIQQNEKINNIINKDQISSSLSLPKIDDHDSKMIKELNKKVYELEKGLKSHINTINIEMIQKEFQNLRQILFEKPNKQEINDMRDDILNTRIEIEHLKTSLSETIEDKRLHMEDVTRLNKKIDSLNLQLVNKNKLDPNNSIMASSNKLISIAMENGKFVEFNDFMDFKNSTIDSLEKSKNKWSELKKKIEEMSEILTTNITDKEFHHFENSINDKLDENKQFYIKKFADKNETNKNLKYLDIQLRNLIEINSKKSDKNDNWLLAKKPLDGFQCASCEGYLGKLQENSSNHIPWNKYPMRDPNDKFFRYGNGFSRMLQTLNIENSIRSDNNHADPLELEIGNSLKQKLPNLEKKYINLVKNYTSSAPETIDDQSWENNNVNTTNDYINTEYHPKIIKITKKNK